MGCRGWNFFKKAEFRRACACALTVSLWGTVVSPAAALAPLSIEMNQSRYYDVASKIMRLAVANPEIADVVTVGEYSFLIVGKKLGTTTLFVWTEDELIQEFEVRVSNADTGLAARLQELIGISTLRVEKSDTQVLLRGTVRNQYEKELAIRMASLYVGAENVIDLIAMTHPSQVNLEVQIVEVTANDAKNIGLQWMSPDSYTYTPPKQTVDGTTGVVTSSEPATWTGIQGGKEGMFFVGEGYVGMRNNNWLLQHLAPINVQIQALVSQGKARVLSRPYITTMSGEKAKIHIGGKIPIPVRNENEVSIEWKDYGIDLEILPKVDSENNITSAILAKVSDLDYANAVKTSAGTYPALRDREAQAVLSVSSGRTMVIGGLINDVDSETITKIPLLGDIPILGEFFKHRAKSKNKHELLILVRPLLVDEHSRVQMSPGMREYRDKILRQEAQTPPVDLNAPPAPEKPDKDQLSPTVRARSESGSRLRERPAPESVERGQTAPSERTRAEGPAGLRERPAPPERSERPARGGATPSVRTRPEGVPALEETDKGRTAPSVRNRPEGVPALEEKPAPERENKR